MRYKIWLLNEENKNFEYYKNIVLSKLGLGYSDGSQSINIWDPNKLIQKLNELGEYVKLPRVKKIRAEAQIRSKVGTINDLIKSISQ